MSRDHPGAGGPVVEHWIHEHLKDDRTLPAIAGGDREHRGMAASGTLTADCDLRPVDSQFVGVLIHPREGGVVVFQRSRKRRGRRQSIVDRHHDTAAGLRHVESGRRGARDVAAPVNVQIERAPFASGRGVEIRILTSGAPRRPGIIRVSASRPSPAPRPAKRPARPPGLASASATSRRSGCMSDIGSMPDTAWTSARAVAPPPPPNQSLPQAADADAPSTAPNDRRAKSRLVRSAISPSSAPATTIGNPSVLEQGIRCARSRLGRTLSRAAQTTVRRS